MEIMDLNNKCKLTIKYYILVVFASFITSIPLLFINHNNNTSINYSLVMILDVLLFAPILEELFFRYLIINKLKKHFQWNYKYYLLISAFLFAIYHMQLYLIPYMVTGVIYGYLYIKTNDIRTSIVCHFLYNLTVLVIYFFI